MMKSLVMTMAVAIYLSGVHGVMEFGRERLHDGARKRTYEGGTRGIKTLKTITLFDEQLEDIIDARSMMELSMSMSMGGPQFPLPPAGPPGPTVPGAPTPSVTSGPTLPGAPTPSVPSAPSTSSAPISTPSSNNPATSPTTFPTASYEPTLTDSPMAVIPVEPTVSPSVSPTQSPTESFEPTITAAPTTVDECPNNGLGLGLSTDNSTTPLFLAVGYQVESTSDVVEVFVDELESTLLNQAVVAILGCEANTTGRIFPQTLEVSTCTPGFDDAEGCFIMETEAIIFVKGDINSDVALFEAYTAIKAYIDAYISGLIPTILRLDFLSPLPIPVPPGSESTSEPIPVSSNRNGGAGVNPWAIGASVGSVLGGILIILYARARKFRQRRLMDEASWVNGNSPE